MPDIDAETSATYHLITRQSEKPSFARISTGKAVWYSVQNTYRKQFQYHFINKIFLPSRIDIIIYKLHAIAGTEHLPPETAHLPDLFEEMVDDLKNMEDIYDQSIHIFLTMARTQFFYDEHSVPLLPGPAGDKYYEGNRVTNWLHEQRNSHCNTFPQTPSIQT